MYPIIDLNPIELNFFPFMISSSKCNGSCNVADDLSTKICVPSEAKDANVKIFNMITKINEIKPLAKHILCDFNANLIVQHVIQVKNGIMVNTNASVKSTVREKRLYLES